ncbi:hypothetical protein [Kineococcus arenarius]|uniref:hypothetical protein n=1 Tax=unclassified Kineococcus TaxID=2621656 RepID=UPI003D7EF43E
MKATVRSIDVRIEKVLRPEEGGRLTTLALSLGFDAQAVVTEAGPARVALRREPDQEEDLSVVIAKLLVVLHATRSESFDDLAEAVVAAARKGIDDRATSEA